MIEFLEISPLTKNRKRTRKVLHPIATDTEIDKEISSSSPLTDNICASPIRRARLLNPRMYLFLKFRIFLKFNLELSAAKFALHSHVSRQICGREDERSLIQKFCTQKSNDKNGDINNPCLYIYGAPGTG